MTFNGSIHDDESWFKSFYIDKQGHKIFGYDNGMAFLKLLLSGSLIFISVTILYANNNTEKCLAVKNCLQTYIEPYRYHLFIEVKKMARDNIIFLITCEINLNITNSTNYITLHAPYLNINEDSISLSLEHDRYKPIQYTYINESNILILDFDRILPQGSYLLIMPKYVISADDDSFFKISLNSLNTTIVTRFGAIGARRVFPCWDEPAFKSVFFIEMKHNIYWVLSNMPGQLNQINKAMTSFSFTPPMTTYDMAFMISNYDFHVANNFRYRSAMDDHITFARNTAVNVAFYLNHHWKVVRKIPRVKHVVIPGFLHDGIQYPGIIFYRETDVIHNGTLDSIGRKIKVARVIGRNVVHEWLENLIGQPYSSLNEAFAVFFGAYAVNKLYSRFGILDLFVIQIQHESFRLTSIIKSLISENYNISKISSFLAYLKVPAILRMLQHAYGITDEILGEAVQKCAEKDWATFNDLWSAMQFVNDKPQISQSENLNITMFLNLWTNQEYYPILKATRHYDNDTIITKIWLQNFDAYQEKQWSWKKWLPLTYTTQKCINFNITSPSRWLKIPEWTSTSPYLLYTINHDLNDIDWIIINIQQVGYYRVNYDDEIWRKIVSFLNSEEYIKVHVLNRAQIIDDAFHFLLANEIDHSIFLNLTRNLERETDYVAWYPMFKALEYMSCFFPYLKNSYIKVHMQSILRDFLRNIGYEEQWYEDPLKKCLRQEAARWACVLGDVECKANATFKLNNHLKYPETQKILPWWKEWTFCNGLDSNVISSALDAWIETPDIKILEFLACSKIEFEQIKHYINAIFKDPENCILTKSNCTDARIEDKDRVNNFLSTVKWRANDYKELDYIKDNFDEIPKEISTVTAFISIINYIYDEKLLDEVMYIMERDLHRKQLFLISSISIKFFGNLKNIHFRNKVLGKVTAIIRPKFLFLYMHRMKIRLTQIINQRSNSEFYAKMNLNKEINLE